MMMLLSPVFVQAEGLVTCGRGADQSVENTCGFKDIMIMINNIITFILTKLALPVCALMFAYAGFILVTAGGESSEAKSKAKGIFTNAAVGLMLVAGAWLIIKTILTTLGYDGGWIGF